MPAVSQQQFKFMKAVESGSVKAPGLTPTKAAEFTKGVQPSKLPRYSKLKDKLKKGY